MKELWRPSFLTRGLTHSPDWIVADFVTGAQVLGLTRSWNVLVSVDIKLGISFIWLRASFFVFDWYS